MTSNDNDATTPSSTINLPCKTSDQYHFVHRASDSISHGVVTARMFKEQFKCAAHSD
jgi:hypothetical protein